jgi:hypothetical protein
VSTLALPPRPSGEKRCIDCGAARTGRKAVGRCRTCHGRQLGRLGYTYRPPGSPERRAAALLRWARALAWCPIEYRDEYRRLRLSKRMLAAEARAAVEEMIAADLKRYRRTGELQQVRRLAA